MFGINNKEDFLNRKVVISYQNKLEMKQIVKVLADNFKDIVWRNGNKPTQLPIIVRHNDGYLLIIDKKLYLSDACETDKFLLLSFGQFNNLIVELNRKPILDEVEKKYLWNIVKPFKNKILSIAKLNMCVNSIQCEFIRIRVEGKIVYRIVEGIYLPYFKKDSMYKNMEVQKEYTLKELGLIEPKKITLTEFWNSKYAMAIHCNTEEKANKLLKAFDKLGKKWISGNSYLLNNVYGVHRKSTCYTNHNCYAHYNWCKRNGYKIFEFDEVDLDN